MPKKSSKPKKDNEIEESDCDILVDEFLEDLEKQNLNDDQDTVLKQADRFDKIVKHECLPQQVLDEFKNITEKKS